MKQAELQHYRAMLQAQAVEAPPKRRLFGQPSAALIVGEAGPAAPPPPRQSLAPRRVSLFGRRRPAPPEALTEPLLLDIPAAASAPVGQRLRLHTPVAAGHFAETPFHAEDLADPIPGGPAPGVIAGWSAAKPPSAQLRLLRRLCAVVDAEHGGLRARLAAAGIEAA